MRKLHLVLLSLIAAFGLAGFSACVSGTGSSSDSTGSSSESSASSDSSSSQSSSPSGSSSGDPVTENTEVTYIFVNGSERLTYTVTQEEGSSLEYGLDTVYSDGNWYSDEEMQTEVTVAAGTSMTVYSEFEDISVFCAYQSDGVQCGFEEVTVREGATLQNAPEKEGYIFLYWESQGETYRAGEQYAFTPAQAEKVVDFTAVWEINSYSVTYLSVGEVYAEETQEYDSSVLPAPERTGYTFLGWFDGENEVTKISKSVTLEAKWQAYSYSVNFDLNGYESETLVNGTYTYGEVINLPQAEKTGYSFEGWEVSLDGGVYTAAEDSYTVGSDLSAKDISFRAVFAAKERNVTLTLAEGTDTAVVKTGENIVKALSQYESEGFSGWFYDEALTDPVNEWDVLPAYADGESLALYASFNQAYTVTFVKSETDRVEKTVTYREAITETAEKEGHSFVGWYTAEGINITTVPAGNVTLYAQFTPNVYVLSYDINGGDIAPVGEEGEYLTSVTVASIGNATRPYHVFLYWTDGENNYNAGDVINLTKDITLTAVWEGYYITLNLTDWDGTPIVDGLEVEAGTALSLPSDSIYNQVDEFDGFYYQDFLGDYHYVKIGDILSEDVTATAYYVNRRTGEQLVFTSASYFVFQERANGTYYISGRNGIFTDNVAYNPSDLSEASMEKVFAASRLPSSIYFPATYNGKLVTAIPNGPMMSLGAFSCYAYANNTGLPVDPYYITGTVYIPSIYDFIGAYAFYRQQATTVEIGRNSHITGFYYYCDIIMNATEFYGFPDNLTMITRYGFQGDSSETNPNPMALYDDEGNRITSLPSSITYIGTYGMANCGFLESIDLSRVTYLGTSAFRNCFSLKEVKLRNSVSSYMFAGCLALESITISKGVGTISEGAFAWAYNLKEVKFEEGSVLKTIGDMAFIGTVVESIELPDSVTTIGDNAFGSTSYGCALTYVKLSSSLETIGNYAFKSADIESIEFYEGLKSIGDEAFAYTNNLRYISLPNSLETIGDSAFAKEPAAYKSDGTDGFVLRFGDNLQTIGTKAFQSFSNVSAITYSENCALTKIGQYAFTGMPYLSGEIVYPSHLQSVGSYTYRLYKTGTTTMIEESSPITSVTFPASLTMLNGYSCAYMPELTSVTFYDNNDPVTVDEEGNEVRTQLTIGNAAFAGCPKLTEIELPSHVALVTGGNVLHKNGAFWNCTNLEKVTFRGREDGNDGPLQITSVAFSGCTLLREIYIDRNTEAEIDFPRTGDGTIVYGETLTSNCFLEDCASNVYLYVKADKYSYYTNSSNIWGKCGHIGRVFTIS